MHWLRSSRLVPVLAVLAYLAFGALYSEAVPAWEAPDEPWHLAYAESMAAGTLPTAGDTYEHHQPPPYYAALGLVLRALDRTAVPRSPDNPWYPYATAALWHAPDDPAVPLLRLLRVLSGNLGALAVALAWASARALRPRRRAFPALAAALVALWPQHLFVAHAVSNDVAAVLAGALATYGLVVWVGTPARGLRAAAVLLAAGALVPLTKLNTVVVLAVLPVGVLAARRSTSPVRTASWAAALRPAVAALAGAALAALALRLAAPSAAANLLAEAAFRAVRLDDHPGAITDITVRVAGLLSSAWARFGWLTVDAPRLVGWLGAALAAGAALGLARAWPGLPGRGRRAALVLAALVLLAVAAGVRNLLSDPQPQGRLLFPALVAAAWLVALGLTGLVPVRVASRLAGLVAAALVAANVWLVGVTLPDSYAAARGPHPALDTRVMPPTRELLGPLRPGRSTAVQTFRPVGPDVGLVAVPIGGVRGEGRLALRLRRGETVLAEREVPLSCESVNGGCWLQLPVGDGAATGAAETLALEIVLLPGSQDARVGLWGTPEDAYPHGALAIPGEKPGDLVLLVLSGGRE